jgi:hypothetical protein
MGKDVSIYGLLAFRPIEFPDAIEIRVHGHDRLTGGRLGWDVAIEPRRSWDWSKRFYRLPDKEIERCESLLKEGETAALRVAIYLTSIDFDHTLLDPYGRSIVER